MAVDMNRQKLVVGGLAAGLVLNIIDFLSNGVIFAARMQADANAFKAGLGDQMGAMGGGEIAVYVFFDFVIGFLLVWTYAAIRPRFGPGPRTAVYAGLVFFVIGLITTYGYKQMGVMSTGLWWSYTAVWFINLVIAAVVGAAVYKEDGPATT
jgi:hypothetical protein